MSFTAKQLNQYETVAEILSQARKEKDIELNKIEKTLKISKKYLEALEKGQYDILPSAIYTKNFAKAYADFLGLDTEKIAKLIQRELEIINQVNKPEETKGEDYSTAKILITPKLVKNIIITILVLACLAYLGWQINAIFSLPPLEIIAPEQDLIIMQNFIKVEGQTLPEVRVTINNQEVLADQKGHFSKEIDLQTGLNTIEIRVKKKHSKEKIEIRQVMVEEEVEIIEGEPNIPNKI